MPVHEHNPAHATGKASELPDKQLRRFSLRRQQQRSYTIQPEQPSHVAKDRCIGRGAAAKHKTEPKTSLQNQLHEQMEQKNRPSPAHEPTTSHYKTGPRPPQLWQTQTAAPCIEVQIHPPTSGATSHKHQPGIKTSNRKA
ncbi:hypothetical protein Nepgr_013549 [Nepenthes gracilis]|uniref:Uncharacterized protein n=1 Tax=Nepenthes gracilis TaxID=150966 RepID=A0AAD3SI63_NEPGR|nr:hypothetical protein Nepgr_013549 [Nepenthes gracilis]